MTYFQKNSVPHRVILYEIFAFIAIILFIWVVEVFDFPRLLFRCPATPINWHESLFETIAISLLALVIIYNTNKIFHRMKYLEGILPVCASCKKIRDENGQWHQIETYIHERSAIDFSHGICPECCNKIYPEFSLRD